MKITVIAQTQMSMIPESIMGTSFEDFFYGDRAALLNDADTLAHFAGRSCYQAWNMPNEATRTNKGYIGNILDQGHFSVLEHASVTFYIEGVSRALLTELTRHRHASFSVESQRYVDYSGTSPVIPPAIRELPDRIAELTKAYNRALISYEVLNKSLLAEGLSRKAAREAARAVLPNCAPVGITLTGNHRAYRDVLYKRYSVHADAEIRELAELLLAELRKIAPATYQDFPNEPFA